MLFVAPEFLLLFLPIALVGYWVLELRCGGGWSMSWLLAASLVFYACSGLGVLTLFLGSLCTNYALGHWLARTKRPWALPLGVGLNLGLLALFKYADFGFASLSKLTGWHLPQWHLRLPIAISFYTFQQIVYLVRCRRDRQSEIPWKDYALAVAFFPHLIAGPLVHYHALVPQFHSQKRRQVALAHFYEALNLFVVALAKKLLIADALSPVAGEIFQKAAQGDSLGFCEGWLGALAYAFQIYFDFSAYSEMALGMALMFGLRLPVNFRRPYAAVDLRDFWKRWHITLSEFLRDYLYIPLGGNRRGKLRRWFNLFVTMLLGGLWHGAGWTFVAWGGLHGLLLAANHAWASLSPVRIPKRISQAMTFVVVVLLWVPFRAGSQDATMRMWTAMAGASASNATVGPAVTAHEASTLDRVLQVIASSRTAKVEAWFWNAVSQETGRAWLGVGATALLVFLFRSNLDFAACDRNRTALRALILGILIFAIAARSFNAPPGEFLYFRF